MSPDGSALVADWRATLMIEASSPRSRLGGSVRVVANLLDDLEADRATARRYFFHHELFSDVTSSTRIGVYHLARLAPPNDIGWDLWADKAWSNEVGLFLRSNWTTR